MAKLEIENSQQNWKCRENKGKRRDFELEAALQNLTSDEVEQRRIRMFGEEPLTYHGSRLERGESITSNGFDSPGK